MNDPHIFKVLYVCDYYRGGVEANGLAEWEANLAKVLQLTSLVHADFFYPDLHSDAVM